MEGCAEYFIAGCYSSNDHHDANVYKRTHMKCQHKSISRFYFVNGRCLPLYLFLLSNDLLLFCHSTYSYHHIIIYQNRSGCMNEFIFYLCINILSKFKSLSISASQTSSSSLCGFHSFILSFFFCHIIIEFSQSQIPIQSKWCVPLPVSK